ncbi:MAG: hypothetical protein QM736_02275 [Vicinamibacterales bacterium]
MSDTADAESDRQPLLIDPKIPHLDHYSGATLITPNHHEAEAATHRVIRNDDEDARLAPSSFAVRAPPARAVLDHPRRTRHVAVERAMWKGRCRRWRAKSPT